MTGCKKLLPTSAPVSTFNNLSLTKTRKAATGRTDSLIEMAPILIDNAAILAAITAVLTDKAAILVAKAAV